MITDSVEMLLRYNEFDDKNDDWYEYYDYNGDITI